MAKALRYLTIGCNGRRRNIIRLVQRRVIQLCEWDARLPGDVCDFVRG